MAEIGEEAETGEEAVRALLPRISTRTRSASPPPRPIPGKTIYKVTIICILMVLGAVAFAFSSSSQDSHSSIMVFWLWFSTVVASISLALDIYDLYATGMDRLSCISFLFSSISFVTCLVQLIWKGEGISPQFYPLTFAIVMCVASVFNLVVDKIIQYIRSFIRNILTSGSHRLGIARLGRSARFAAIQHTGGGSATETSRAEEA